jgi:filamentous hemagglutinin family protein
MAFPAKINRVIFALLSLCSLPVSVVAQEAPITADGTTATNVTTPDGSNFDLSGGDKAGGNLFHSFGNFSVPNGGSANFLNSPDIVNIINRVTGGKISEINGLLRANGSANLFLINPAGIVFGSGASLNIGGSFLGSTADSLVFPDGEFSAVNAEGKPLLTINAPIGLGIRDNPAPITLNNSTVEINAGKNVSLVGGNISLDNSELSLSGGRIELGGLSAAGTITFNRDDSLKFPDNVAKSDITLSNNSFISLDSSVVGGSIAINAKNLSLDNSVLASGIFEEREIVGTQVGNIDINADSVFLTNNSFISSRTFGTGDVGDININAKKEVRLDNSLIANFVGDTGQGESGNINIQTSSLNLTNDARLITATLGQGDSGSIEINAIDNVVLDNSIIDSFTGSTGVGNSGEIAIAAKNLFISNGGQISTATLGQGNSGDISIQATDNVSIDGESSSGFFRSGIQTSTEEKGRGDSGDINIETGSLTLTNNATINASTFGVGNAGNINVKTRNFSLADGAQINSSTFGVGNSGNVTIAADDTVKLSNAGIFSNVESGAVGNSGTIDITAKSLTLEGGAQVLTSIRGFDSETNIPGGVGNAGTINVNATDTVNITGKSQQGDSVFPSELGSFIERGAEGSAGSINIASKNISISNSAQISVDQQGIGNGGNLNISTDSLTLNNKASILGTTNSGEAGNIGINVKDILSIRDNSLIKVEASPNIDGGQLFFNAGFIVAFPSQKPNDGNDIVFNTGQGTGRGGNFGINTQSIFGMQLRPDDPGNGTNDISVANQSIDFSLTLSR